MTAAAIASAVSADVEAASVGCAPAADVEAVDVGSAAMLTTRRGSFPGCVLVTCHIAGLVLGGICKIVKSTPLIAAACVQPAHKGLDVREPFDLPTPINSKASYLLSYDKLDASILLDGFSMGFPLHYDGPQPMRFSDNHHSALQAPQLVDKKIDTK
ncbi:hypothetical protein LSAT2_008640 [Lamellibrachia satsuma]|nr:hypothetical protein LSAT2_008640 [Lamellibrachia satsuma]